MKKYIYLFFLMMLWIIFTEKITIERIVIGFIVSIIIYLFYKEFYCKGSRKNINLKTFYYLTIYLLILMKEIVIANFDVAKIVLSPRMQISPMVVRYKTRLKSDFNKTILANSITLTPGTFTVSLEGNTLLVHCLQKEYMHNIINSPLEKILLKIEEYSLC